MPTKKESKDSSSESDFIALAKKRFQFAVEYEGEIRKLAVEDMKFAAGEQWPNDVKQSRESENRPCLTINRMPQFIRNITNDQRQNRPSIKVSPTDDKATKETAEIIQGLIRHIEYASNADTAYDTAFDRAVRSSFGFFRIITDYVSPESFDQEIKIKRIRNQMSCYLDPSSQEPDGSDAEWGFVFEDIPVDDFKEKYPKCELAAMTDWTSVGDVEKHWINKDTVRIAEYFYKEYSDVTLAQLSDGTVVNKAKLDESTMPEGVEIKQERKARVPQVKWAKINAIEILEESDWAGCWIPIVPVIGDEQEIEGKRVLEGLVRHAKDSQRMYNYFASNEAEAIALAPKAPWVGAEGQFEGHPEWQTANTKSHAKMEYKPTSYAGQLMPPPQRNVFEPPVQAITNARGLAAEDIKATTGIYDASLGNKSNENSGVAIQRRNVQSQTSNFHYVDNLTKSMRHAGRIIVDLIPHIYDTERTVRIIHEDGQEDMVQINQLFKDEETGKDMIYELGVGTYDVVIGTGPSFETRRQEALSSMLDLSSSNPQIMQAAGDIMVRNMDWPGADQVADRLQKLLPPQLQGQQGQQAQLPPQAKQQMDQMSGMIQTLSKQLHVAKDMLDNKTLELESRERIAAMSNQTQLQLALLKTNAAAASQGFEADLEHIDRRLSLLNNDVPIMQEQGQVAQMAAQSQAQSMQPPQQNQNGAGPQPAVSPPQQQPPTGGSSPGQPMGAP